MTERVQYHNIHLGAMFTYHGKPYRLERFVSETDIEGRAMLKSMKPLFLIVPFAHVTFSIKDDPSIWSRLGSVSEDLNDDTP